jgi:hypothetical protein
VRERERERERERQREEGTHIDQRENAKLFRCIKDAIISIKIEMLFAPHNIGYYVLLDVS